MSGVREVRMEEGSGLRSGAASGEPEASREVRWSGRRKEQVVLRLLRGESLDLLARETGQPAGRIVGWREEFLQAGREGLRSRPLPAEERELADAQRKVGELQLENDTCGRCWRRRGALRCRGARGERAVARAVEDGLPGGGRIAVGGVRAARRRGVSASARRKLGPVGAMEDGELGATACTGPAATA